MKFNFKTLSILSILAATQVHAQQNLGVVSNGIERFDDCLRRHRGKTGVRVVDKDFKAEIHANQTFPYPALLERFPSPHGRDQKGIGIDPLLSSGDAITTAALGQLAFNPDREKLVCLSAEISLKVIGSQAYNDSGAFIILDDLQDLDQSSVYNFPQVVPTQRHQSFSLSRMLSPQRARSLKRGDLMSFRISLMGGASDAYGVNHPGFLARINSARSLVFGAVTVQDDVEVKRVRLIEVYAPRTREDPMRR